MVDCTFAEQLNPRGGCLGKPCGYDGLHIYNATLFEPSQVPDVQHNISFLKNIMKTPLGQPPLKRHLTAFKAWPHTAAGPGIGSLMTTA
jgi:hypothetical protein